MKTNLDLNKHRRRNHQAIHKAAVGKKPFSSKNAFIITAAVILIGFIFFELNDRFFRIDGVPTWDEIFKASQLSEDFDNVEGDLSVHFLDVGQGDCQLIKSGSMSVLIDCGEREYYSRVIRYLRGQNIETLDYVVVTHPHSDHMGGMSYILEEFNVETVIMPKLPDEMTPATSSYLNLLNTVQNNNISLVYAEPNTEYQLNNATMTVLTPLSDYESLNNYSAAVKLSHGENTFLFTGDMETEAESDLIGSGADISAKVLKVGHHGSTSSTSSDFLESVNPRYAIIEVGSPNDFGHPHSQVIKRLENKNIEIYRTDKNGNIVFVSNGNDLTILTEKDTK